METISVPNFTSDRVFDIFDAEAGSRFLLVRSSGGMFAENIDLIFGLVLYVELPFSMYRISVTKPCDERAVELEKRFTTYQSANYNGEFVYAIESGGERFHVVASALWIHINTLPTSSLAPMNSEGKEEYYAKFVQSEYRLN